jgi:hypothetical protein
LITTTSVGLMNLAGPSSICQSWAMFWEQVVNESGAFITLYTRVRLDAASQTAENRSMKKGLKVIAPDAMP